MVDALRSGRSGSNPMEVQILSRPPKNHLYHINQQDISILLIFFLITRKIK